MGQILGLGPEGDVVLHYLGRLRGFLHARATAGWRGRRAAYIQLVGFVCLMFNLVGVNIWITGLHSYAGLG